MISELFGKRRGTPPQSPNKVNVESILCVCTGNICRSPLAERLLAHALPDVNVGSAGIGALSGHPMDSAALAIARREGLTPEAHVARQLTQAMVRESDLMLVMELRQKEWIEKRYPKSRGRVFMISHWHGGEDIEDPYQQPGRVFDAVYRELTFAANDWRTWLLA